jgi:hypothetical protein
MGHGLLSRRRLGAAGVLVVLCVLALLAGTARAAMPAMGDVGPGQKSTSFTGQFDTPATLSDPSMCPPQAVDPIDSICGHFTIQVQAAGVVSVTIAFDPENDLDLCVYDQLNQQVACSAQGDTSSETVSFLASAAGPFEARIIPFMFPFPGPMPMSPAFYSGTVTYTGGTAKADDDGGTTPATGCVLPTTDRLVHGHGHILPATMSTERARFAFNVKWRADKRMLKGKIAYREDHAVNFKGKFFTCVVFNDASRTVTIFGHGTNNGHDVDFQVDATDGGEHGMGDTFQIQLTDGFTNGGPVTDGDVDYEP